MLVQHGGTATTRLSYDAQTERLVACSSVAANGKPLQGLSYTHDALGNIVRIADASRPAVYAGNAKHEAVNDYRYDGLYRLVEATGREHIGQIDGKTPRASAPVVAAEPNDAGALRQYVQRYRYDAAGNLLRLEHAAGAGSYTRVYAYADRGNRLRATGRHEAELFERYRHDAGGHMLAMPHLNDLRWNEVGELDRVRIGTMTAYFQYAGGVRVRKYVLKGGSVVEDHRIVDGVEVFIKGKRGAYGAVQVTERTETEVFGDAGLRIDRKTKRDGVACDVVHWRYALHDHLGSVAVEVDRAGKVISREEYHPWGTTAVRAVTSELGVSPRQHRYLARERDDETGLALHGARYYAPWLGRWTAADPIGLAGGFNRYAYCRGSPVTFSDVDGHAERLATDGAYIPYASSQGASDIVCDDDHVRGASKADRFLAGGFTDILAVEGADPVEAFERSRQEHAAGRRRIAELSERRRAQSKASAPIVAGIAIGIVTGGIAAWGAAALELGSTAVGVVSGAIGGGAGSGSTAALQGKRGGEIAEEAAIGFVFGGIFGGVLAKVTSFSSAARMDRAVAIVSSEAAPAPVLSKLDLAAEMAPKFLAASKARHPVSDHWVDMAEPVPAGVSEGAEPGLLYRGVHAKHPALEDARAGRAVPGDPNGSVSAELHNGGDGLDLSPMTSWTRDLAYARRIALSEGPGGVILVAPVGAPPPDATWRWVWSPDEWWENEVLLWGIRTGLRVLQP